MKANHPEKTIHPCQFPIELIQRCVLALISEQDTILDPFLGVGSTIIASIMHKRRGVGIELDDEYIAIANKRIDDYLDDVLKIRPLSKPVYQPTGREKVSQIPLNWLNNNIIK